MTEVTKTATLDPQQKVDFSFLYTRMTESTFSVGVSNELTTFVMDAASKDFHKHIANYVISRKDLYVKPTEVGSRHRFDVVYACSFADLNVMISEYRKYCRETKTNGFNPITGFPVPKELTTFLYRHVTIESLVVTEIKAGDPHYDLSNRVVEKSEAVKVNKNVE